jgi:hypothetical protein
LYSEELVQLFKDKDEFLIQLIVVEKLEEAPNGGKIWLKLHEQLFRDFLLMSQQIDIERVDDYLQKPYFPFSH